MKAPFKQVGVVVTREITIKSGENILDLIETDQVAPAGRWRLRLDGDKIYFDRATAADWSTFETWLTYDKASEKLILGKKLDANTLEIVNPGNVDGVDVSAHKARHEAGGADAMAVDAVVATGSLRTLGAGAQQAAAGDHVHTLAEDVTGSAISAITTTASGAGQYLNQDIGGGADVDLATKTLTYAAMSRAVAVGVFSGKAGSADRLKIRLYMDGVQVAESGYVDAVGGTPIVVVGTRALSGETICKVAVHNYSVETPLRFMTPMGGENTPVPIGIGCGSLKV